MTVYSYNAQPANLSLIVVSGMGLSLFGRNWLTTICLDWKSIGIVASQLHKQNFMYTLIQNPSSVALRPVPYTLHDKVEAELECL